MTYKRGDYVYPQDLPRRFLCQVSETERLNVRDGRGQILKLSPLEGPWPEGTFLIRLDKAVRPAKPRNTLALAVCAAARTRGHGEEPGPAPHGEAA
jgi:hypothetical protein